MVVVTKMNEKFVHIVDIDEDLSKEEVHRREQTEGYHYRIRLTMILINTVQEIRKTGEIL